MKIIHENTNYALLVIQVIIIGFFIASCVLGYVNTRDYFNLTEGYDGFSSIYNSIIYHAYFRSSAILLIPIIGIFLKKKIGWVFFTSYFYFLFTNIIYPYISGDYSDYNYTLAVIIALAIVSLFIFIMNKKKTSLDTYKILPSVLIPYNILAFIIGVSITFFLVYLKG